MASDSLEELQKAAQELRDGLRNVDDDIKKLTGRDPSETPRPGSNRRIQLKRNSFQSGNRQDGPLNKQRRDIDRGGARRWGRTVQIGARASLDEDTRLDSSGEEDESSKPAIQSVIATELKPVRHQNKSIDEDRQVKSRNKRMFGLLIGTLQKFKEDTKQKSAAERKREEIEKKLDQKAELEKQEVSSQRKELFQTRKQKQQELRNLERKMENAVLKEEIAAHNKDFANCIKLKSKPHIFYIPAIQNDTTRKLLKESKAALQESQNARFRDMDVDADEFGFNDSFNRRGNNGKKLMGRAVEVKDVSHRDLFEEDRMQEEEIEREENQKGELNEEKSLGDTLVEMRDETKEDAPLVAEEHGALLDGEEREITKEREIVNSSTGAKYLKNDANVTREEDNDSVRVLNTISVSQESLSMPESHGSVGSVVSGNVNILMNENVQNFVAADDVRKVETDNSSLITSNNANMVDGCSENQLNLEHLNNADSVQKIYMQDGQKDLDATDRTNQSLSDGKILQGNNVDSHMNIPVEYPDHMR